MIDLKAINSMSLRSAAETYMNEGWTIIPLAPRSKSPGISKGWIDDNFVMAKGKEHWDYYLTDNIGVNLGKTGIVTLDIDNKDEFLMCMDAVDKALHKDSPADTPFWLASTVAIMSGRRGSGKLVFEAPDDIRLEPKKLRWVSNGRGSCVFELRTWGQQDALPPSIHPETLKPYQWFMPGDKPYEIQPMPEDLLQLWMFWEKYLPIMEKANPAYVEPVITDKMKQSGKKYTGTNYIDMWKSQQNLESMLTSNGYVRKGNNRYLSPDSHSGNAGIVVYDGGTTFYSFGESDKFADGHTHDAYDLLVECEYNGDRKAAWEHILDYFGVDKHAEKVKYAMSCYNEELRRKLAAIPKRPVVII